MKLIVLFLTIFSLSFDVFAVPGVDKTTISDYLNISHQSADGNEFPLYIYKSNPGTEPDYRFLIQGGLHGNETLTTDFVNWLAENMPPLTKKEIKFEVHFIPMANPDSHGQSRYNRNSVNLNRNFSVLWGLSKEPNGSAAFSEPETKAIRALMKKHSYLAAIDVHGYINWIVTPTDLTASQNQKADRLIRKFKAWKKAVDYRTSSIFPNYKVKSAGSLGDGGAFEDWAFWEMRSMSVCLELFSQKRFVRKNNETVDTFPIYKSFIVNLFSDAIAIDQSLESQVSLARAR